MDTNREAVDRCLFVCISGWKSVASVNHLKKSSQDATNLAYSIADSTNENSEAPTTAFRKRLDTARRLQLLSSFRYDKGSIAFVEINCRADARDSKRLPPR